MKKVYISADIEGIWGNANPAYTIKTGREYEEYRTNMIEEVNLCIKLLLENGAEEVVVNDGHGNMDNILASKLDKRASLVVSNGAYKEYGMMEGLDDSFDAVCFVGYHCRSNTPGVMSHTIWGSMVNKITLDGKEVGESGLNARLAWEYGVPVTFVSGDDKLKQQVEEELQKPFVFVETKKAVSSQCAICCSREELERRYAKGISDMKTISYSGNSISSAAHELKITFHHARNAEFVSRMDGVDLVDYCTVRIQKNTYKELYAYMRFVIKVCNAFAM